MVSELQKKIQLNAVSTVNPLEIVSGQEMNLSHACSTEEAFLKDFLEILKQVLQTPRKFG